MPNIGIEYTSRHIEKIEGEGFALYQAILEKPYDVAPRLIYADWLREHGDEERADFIQWMIELKDFDVHAHEQISHRFKANDCRMILDKNLATWHGLEKPTAGSLYGGMTDLPYSDINLYWRNGFVDSANFVGNYKNYFSRHLSQLVKVHPIRAVSFDMLVPTAMAYLINRTNKRGDNLFGEVIDIIPNELQSHRGMYFFESAANFDELPGLNRHRGNLLQYRTIDDIAVLPRDLFNAVCKHGYKLVIHMCEFVVFDGEKNAKIALSNGAIDCARSMAGLTPLAEHPAQVFNFKIDDPWFNPLMRERLPYYRYPTRNSAAIARNTVTGSGMGFYTDDKKEGE